MRLFAKYSRVSVMIGILALSVGSVGFFFTVRYVLLHQLDDNLRIEEEEILDHVSRENRLPQPANYRDQLITFVPVAAPVRREFRHSTWGKLEREVPNVRKKHPNEPCRLLVFPVKIDDQYYTAFVSLSEEESEDLLWMIMVISAGMILLMLGMMVFANRFLLRRIWKPFYRTLEGIRTFNLPSRQPLPEVDTDIEEFRSLDEAARQMTRQISRDYEMLKNFTDNASHEMQTPLAILNSKLDLLIQDTNLREEHHRPVQAMYDAIGRLRQLNQSLLLLTRIENNQFIQTEAVDMAPLIEEKLLQLEDPLRDRKLQVHTELDRIQLPVNGYLADVLINNLLTNAIRHNQDGGNVDIQLREQSLRISNSGPAPGFDTTTIFDRFVKGAHSGGTGLGLAIVRQICDNYQFPVGYSYASEVHTVEIRFIAARGR